jgi:hypothetical protein
MGITLLENERSPSAPETSLITNLVLCLVFCLIEGFDASKLRPNSRIFVEQVIES